MQPDINIYKSRTDDITQMTTGQVEEATKAKTAAKVAEIASEQAELLEAQLDTKNPLAIVNKLQKKVTAFSATIKKAKETKAAAKMLIPVKEIESSAQKFKRDNPKFSADPSKLKDLVAEITERLKSKEGISFEDILEIIKKAFPGSLDDASAALNFIVSLGMFEETDLVPLQMTLNKEINDQRAQQVTQKSEEEVAEVIRDTSATALKIVEGGDLKKLLEHLMNNPIEATAIFKILDDAYGQDRQSLEVKDKKRMRSGGSDLKKIELFLLKGCGVQVNKIREITDKEDIAHMKNVISLLKSLQAIIGVDRYFENRNKDVPDAKQRKLNQPTTT